MEVKKYVLGFLFNSAGDAVILIEKLTPEWQRGKLNGVGGKIEEGEYPAQAMTREFMEEAGALIYSWEEFAVMAGQGWQVHCFRHFNDYDFMISHACEQEAITKLSTFMVDQEPVMANLPMLLALAKDKSGLILPVRLTYGS